MHRILFVCTANTNRSPVAEYLAKHHLSCRLNLGAEKSEGSSFSIGSAGLDVVMAGEMSAPALTELARRGIDASAHRSRRLSRELAESADRIYAAAPEHVEEIMLRYPRAADRVQLIDPSGEPVPDPYYGSAYEHRVCAERIERAVITRIDEWLGRRL